MSTPDAVSVPDGGSTPDGGSDAPPTRLILSVKGLSVRYGTVLAVDGVDIDLPENGAVALLGVNGAGKSSLLSAISGLTPYDGEVVLDGSSINKRSAQHIARMGIAHVPEGRRLFPNLTVHENLQVSKPAVGGRSATYSPDDIYSLFPPLVPLRRRHAWSLSGGEQQMVAIGRALCASPRVLLLDEPTLGLAPVVVDALYDALVGLRGELAILLVEQATDLALSICDDAYVLRTGRVVLHGPASELRDRSDLMETFVG